jgi:AraC-like DNA-binding protein
MLHESIINDLGKIIVFLLVLLSVFLITVKSNRKLPNYLFAAFLWVTAIDLTGLFLPVSGSQIIMTIKITSVLFQMPLFFLYVRSVCYFNFKLHKKHFFHSILFFLFFAFFVCTPSIDGYYEIYKIASKMQYYGYITAIFVTLHMFKKVYQENYSSNHHLLYRWLFHTTILFLVGNSFVTIRDYMDISAVSLAYLNLVISVFALSVICWFVLKALYQPQLFVGINIDLVPFKPATEFANKESKEIKKLTLFMEREKPYLDDQLTLQKLADRIEMPEKNVSKLINQQLGKHFFDFINQYRIQESKKLLSDKTALTVLEIVYQLGFNSKSSFYTAFKKETGQTPTAYRKSNY